MKTRTLHTYGMRRCTGMPGQGTAVKYLLGSLAYLEEKEDALGGLNQKCESPRERKENVPLLGSVS